MIYQHFVSAGIFSYRVTPRLFALHLTLDLRLLKPRPGFRLLLTLGTKGLTWLWLKCENVIIVNYLQK